tara:strand:+ start:10363 stop:12018 length:1656 start_codon:yes stop_codon:yes gene_type:complete
MKNGKKKLICTGFHRSATSATAHYLANAGLNMGTKMLGPNISNPKGHFEDRDVVSIHDDWLRQSGTSWQYHGEVELNYKLEQLQEYVTKRSAESDQWGVKDPRTCLFLPQWDSILGENGCYLLILRHWSSCIESLLHRHSRELAYQMPNDLGENAHFKFWLEPNLAAKAWLTYTDAMLHFARQNPDKVLLVTQRSLLGGAPLISALNDKFGLSLNDRVDSGYENSLLRDSASKTIQDGLSLSIRTKLDSLWEQGLNLADFRAEDENPVFRLSKIASDTLLRQYQTALTVRLQQTEATSFVENISIPHELSAVEFSAWLEAQIANKQSDMDLSHLEVVLKRHYPTDGIVWLASAKIYLQKQQWQLARSMFEQAQLLGTYFPYMAMHLGRCYEQLGDYIRASFFYDKALRDNPKNPTFYIAKAHFLINQNNLDKAIDCLSLGMEKLGNIPKLVAAYANIMIDVAQYQEAKLMIDNISDEYSQSPIILSVERRLVMYLDYRKGIVSYQKNAAEKVKEKKYDRWLANALVSVCSPNAELDFIMRCEGHWQDLDLI